MATTVINIIPAKLLEASLTEQYLVSDATAATVRVTIDAVAVTNVSGTARDFSCYLVSNNDSAQDSNLLIDERRIEPGETYLCPETIGQVLENGDSIVTLASAASALMLRASGRVITT